MGTTWTLSLVAALAGCGAHPRHPRPAAADASSAGASSAADTPAASFGTSAFFESISMRGGWFSHDGSQLLVTSDACGVYSVIAFVTDGSGQEALTHSSTDPRYGLSSFPSDDRFLYSADINGNERSQLFVMQPDGTSVDVMPGDDTRAGDLGWSSSGAAFYITANLRNSQADDVYEVSVGAGHPQTLVFENLASLRVKRTACRWSTCCSRTKARFCEAGASVGECADRLA